MPVAEIQFRKYADPAQEQLNNCGTLRWRTANQFAAPIVVRMPGGLRQGRRRSVALGEGEVPWAHAIGLAGGDSVERGGRGGTAARGDAQPEPDDLLRASLAADDERRERALSGRRVRAAVRQVAHGVREGDRVTVVSWGAMVHRCRDAANRFDGDVHLIDLRTIAPWDREAVLESVRRTGRCLIVHEDTSTAGFGAEIAAVLAREAFWYLDAPIERLAVDDVPMPYHPVLLDAVLPDADRIAERIACCSNAWERQ